MIASLLFEKALPIVKYFNASSDVFVNLRILSIEEMDLLSSYLVTLREKCKISPVVIQQANREQGNIERFKAGKSAFTINDAKDSGNTVQDCNIMLALYNPFRDALKTYKGYDISQLNGIYRSILVLKNRFGDCDVEVGTAFYGWINYFHELPKPDEIYDYSKYQNADWLINLDNYKHGQILVLPFFYN